MSKNRLLTVAFILLLIGLMLISQVRAEIDVPKPSIPEFTLTYANNVNPDKRAVEFSLTNQPFSQYIDENGTIISLYYNFRFRAHEENEWIYYPISSNGNSTFQYYSYIQLLAVPWEIHASNSSSTSVSITLSILAALHRNAVEGDVDFQAQALIGHIDQMESNSTPYLPALLFHFTGEASDWSNTKTVAIPYTPVASVSPSGSPFPSPFLSPSPTIAPTIEPTSTPEPTLAPKQQTGFLGTNLPSEYGYAIVAVLVILVVAVLSLVYLKKLRK